MNEPDATRADAAASRRPALARARRAAGYTQESLAERIGVDRTTISRWEAGRTEPLPHLRPKLSKLLGLASARLEEILAHSDSPPARSPLSLTMRAGRVVLLQRSKRPEAKDDDLVRLVESDGRGQNDQYKIELVDSDLSKYGFFALVDATAPDRSTIDG